MLKLRPLTRAKGGDEIGDKLILRFLRQCYSQQLEPRSCRTLARVVGKTKIAGKAKIEIGEGKAQEAAIIHSLLP